MDKEQKKIFKGVIDKNIREGYLEIEGNKLRLTRKGLFYGNEVFSEFFIGLITYFNNENNFKGET